MKAPILWACVLGLCCAVSAGGLFALCIPLGLSPAWAIAAALAGFGFGFMLYAMISAGGRNDPRN